MGKQIVLHPNQMSRSAAVLMVKRSSCVGNKCAVFKTGLCIDLRRNIWSSAFNDNSYYKSIGSKMGAQRKEFGRLAKKLLKKHNNKLPEKYQCSDSRHRFLYQNKHNNKWGYFVNKHNRHRDAELAKNSLLNY